MTADQKPSMSSDMNRFLFRIFPVEYISIFQGNKRTSYRQECLYKMMKDWCPKYTENLKTQ